MAATTQYRRLLDSIKGQEVFLPDLRSLFIDWPGVARENINPYHQALTEAVNERLNSLYSNEIALRKLKLSDFGTFAALWWPSARFDELKILAFLVIWLFTWDDELDEPSGLYANSFEAAQEYRAETIRFVRHCLKVHDGSDHETIDEPCPVPANTIIESFRPIAEGFCLVYNLDQRQRLFEEILRMVVMTQREQEWWLAGRVPMLDEYWRVRLGTSAVYVGVAGAEYCSRASIPNEIVNSPDMRSIWDETNILISITNDLLSMKKEMKQDCIYSIVPLACATGKSVRESVSESILALKASKHRFDRAATFLREQTLRDEMLSAKVEQFVRICRSNVVGNLVWSLKTHRYGMGDVMKKDGCQVFIL